MAQETARPPVGLPSRRWWRPGDGRRLTVAIVACALLAALVTWALPRAGVPMRTGPLAFQDGGDVALDAAPDPGTTSYGSRFAPDPVGTRFTYGMDVLRMPPGSDASAVITKVEPLGLDPGLRYLGAMLGSSHRRDTWQRIDRWPPPQGPVHDPVPLTTPITSATQGAELYLGFEVTRPGSFVTDGWRITYQVSGRTYRYTIPAQMVACTRETTRRRFCPSPDDR